MPSPSPALNMSHDWTVSATAPWPRNVVGTCPPLLVIWTVDQTKRLSLLSRPKICPRCQRLPPHRDVEVETSTWASPDFVGPRVMLWSLHSLLCINQAVHNSMLSTINHFWTSPPMSTTQTEEGLWDYESTLEKETTNQVKTLGHLRLRHAETNEVILIPEPSADPKDPLNWPRSRFASLS